MFDGLRIEVSGRPQSDSAEVPELSGDHGHSRRLECPIPPEFLSDLRLASQLLFNAGRDRSKISRFLQSIAPKTRPSNIPLLKIDTEPRPSGRGRANDLAETGY